MTGTFVDMKAEDSVRIIEAMDEVWEWISGRHGETDYIEIIVAPEGADWFTITTTEKDLTCIQGKMASSPKSFFHIECLASGVREREVRHRIFHALEDTDIVCSVNGENCCDCHDHHECGCGSDHDHDKC